MNPKTIFISTLVLFVLCVVMSASGLSMTPYDKGYSITNVIEDSDLVVYGEVVKKEFVRREAVTTDITIEVKETIKEKPNAGADRVMLTLPCGEFIDPKTGESVVSWMAGTPEFEVGEEVLLFLAKYTHGGYHVFRFREGKRPVQGLKVPIEYTVRYGIRREIHLPIDLAIQIAKAAVKHPEATRQLEEEIKAHIRYSEMFTDTLRVKAKIIQDAACRPPPSRWLSSSLTRLRV